jgi:uncharacterized protein YndB with AHSA1/START domain
MRDAKTNSTFGSSNGAMAPALPRAVAFSKRALERCDACSPAERVDALNNSEKDNSMSPQPTGYLVGNNLVLTRVVLAPIDDVWMHLTKSANTARWFGPWEGDAGPGKIVRLQLVHEKGQPWTDILIEECEAPRRLVVSMKDESGAWRIEVSLIPGEDKTELRFVQYLADRGLAGDVGPGWEYYLDMLLAAREGTSLPSFEDYYPAQKEYYLEAARQSVPR